MNYWIFCCNPEKYLLDKRLADAGARRQTTQTTWRVNQYREKIQAGDVAFIWETGKKAGIRARILINSEPRDDMPEMPHELPYYVRHDCGDGLSSAPCMRVEAIIEATTANLPCDKVKNTQGLENMKIFRDWRHTNCEITEDEGKILCKLLADCGCQDLYLGWRICLQRLSFVE